MGGGSVWGAGQMSGDSFRDESLAVQVGSDVKRHPLRISGPPKLELFALVVAKYRPVGMKLFSQADLGLFVIWDPVSVRPRKWPHRMYPSGRRV